MMTEKLAGSDVSRFLGNRLNRGLQKARIRYSVIGFEWWEQKVPAGCLDQGSSLPGTG